MIYRLRHTSPLTQQVFWLGKRGKGKAHVFALENAPIADQSRAMLGDVFEWDDQDPEDAKVIASAKSMICELVPLVDASVTLNLGIGVVL